MGPNICGLNTCRKCCLGAICARQQSVVDALAVQSLAFETTSLNMKIQLWWGRSLRDTSYQFAACMLEFSSVDLRAVFLHLEDRECPDCCTGSPSGTGLWQ